MIEEKIKEQIRKALKALGLPRVDDVELEHPADEKNGDYSSNIAMNLFGSWKKLQGKSLKEEKKKVGAGETAKGFYDRKLTYKSPRQLAEKIVRKIKIRKSKSEVIEKVEVAGPGFVNFYLSERFLLGEIKRVLHLKELYGKSGELKGKKIMVEYAHPNTHKQFHIGHLRNICIGESLVRILQANGAKVVRVNYQGDVGLHVAKAVWGVMQKYSNQSELKKLEKEESWKRMEMLGKAYAQASSAYDDSKKTKEEIMQINKDIYEQKKGTVLDLWKQTRQWSLDYFEDIYKRLYTKYDRLYFESEVHEPGKKNSLQALNRGVLEKSKGAVVFKGEKYGLDTRVFLTGEGLPTYEAKELGLAPMEFSDFGKLDLNIHVVAPEQTSFFEVTFKVEEILDPDKYKGKQLHLKYGFVDLREGKMSSRKGVVVTGSSVIDEAKRKINKILEDSDFSNKDKEQVSEVVAVGAVKYAMLKQGLTKNISFSIDESVNLEGDSGPYIQYTYARTKSVLKKANIIKSNQAKISYTTAQFHSLSNEEERVLVRWLYRYPEIIKLACEEYSPSLICQYIFELAQRFNAFYNKHSILKADNKTEKEFRLGLTMAVGQLLENGLGLLGIKAPEKM